MLYLILLFYFMMVVIITIVIIIMIIIMNEVSCIISTSECQKSYAVPTDPTELSLQHFRADSTRRAQTIVLRLEDLKKGRNHCYELH